MQTIGAFEAKTHFSALLEQVEHGEPVIITKHGRSVAKLIPISTPDRTVIKKTIERLQQFSQGNILGDDLDWKTLRDEGRK